MKTVHKVWHKRARPGRLSTERPIHFRHFILIGASLFILLMAFSTTMFSFVFAPQESFFFNLSAALIINWIFILTLYYVWAIQFYNVTGASGEIPIKKNDDVSNSNADETLGLPPGTVRGTLALSMLVAGMAMMIASLGMPASMKRGETVVDHFEFLKTGFIMVIAFYFGTKSLEILRDKKGAAKKEPNDAGTEPSTDNGSHDGSVFQQNYFKQEKSLNENKV